MWMEIISQQETLCFYFSAQGIYSKSHPRSSDILGLPHIRASSAISLHCSRFYHLETTPVKQVFQQMLLFLVGDDLPLPSQNLVWISTNAAEVCAIFLIKQHEIMFQLVPVFLFLLAPVLTSCTKPILPMDCSDMEGCDKALILDALGMRPAWYNQYSYQIWGFCCTE